MSSGWSDTWFYNLVLKGLNEMSEELESAIKQIISENWVASWGNWMSSDSRAELERQCLQLVNHVDPNPVSIVINALIKTINDRS